ncbi:hypothetical protein PCANC_27280 [Puccinia coronata f. sp. avenae]|uniref:Uncharacterized protein n=1 Tax=Puccinia coronata f. sp. avenae TaxID=200324 RepID=A0A2N5TIB7_9BASI|nr:hypothetical protein PCANC_27280 [Puccinia coronata f. sp. avenae]
MDHSDSDSEGAAIVKEIWAHAAKRKASEKRRAAVCMGHVPPPSRPARSTTRLRDKSRKPSTNGVRNISARTDSAPSGAQTCPHMTTPQVFSTGPTPQVSSTRTNPTSPPSGGQTLICTAPMVRSMLSFYMAEQLVPPRLLYQLDRARHPHPRWAIPAGIGLIRRISADESRSEAVIGDCAQFPIRGYPCRSEDVRRDCAQFPIRTHRPILMKIRRIAGCAKVLSAGHPDYPPIGEPISAVPTGSSLQCRVQRAPDGPARTPRLPIWDAPEGRDLDVLHGGVDFDVTYLRGHRGDTWAPFGGDRGPAVYAKL